MRDRRGGCALATVACLVAGSLVWRGARADDLATRLSGSIGVRYDDNPSHSVAAPRPATIVSVAPALTLDDKAERYSWKANASMAMERSSDTRSSGNRDDPSLRFSGSYLFPRTQFDFASAFLRQSTRTTQLADTGLLQADQTQTTRRFETSLSHALSASSRVFANDSLERVAYSGGDFVGYSSGMVEAGVEHDSSPTHTWRAMARFRRYVPDTSLLGEVVLRGVYGELKSSLTPNLSVDLLVGTTRLQAGPDSGSRWAGQIDIRQAGYRGQLRFHAGRTYRPNATGGVSVSDSVSGGILYGLSARESLGLDAGWYSTADALAAAAHKRTSSYRAGLRWQWQASASLTWRLSYTYRAISGGSAGRAVSNRLMLGLRYSRGD